MEKRNIGLDIFRIMCCIGVLVYHIVDDILSVGGYTAKGLYYGASYCIPGFFLLSGYLIAKKKNLDIDYCENKVKVIVQKFLGWIIFWVAVRFILTNEILDVWEQFFKGFSSTGILPVAWFLFTYIILIIAAYPIKRLLKGQITKWIVTIGVLVWMVAVALGLGNSLMETKTQALWLHLYLGYFIMGMVLSEFSKYVCETQGTPKTGIFSIIWLLLTVVYWRQINITGGSPHQYYGKWYYTLWLLCLFILIVSKQWNVSEKMRNNIKKVSRDTFTVYLGHLPVLMYITAIRPLRSLFEAVLCILLLFMGLIVVAQIFRKLPLFRKIV